jgi:hypothetical protein
MHIQLHVVIVCEELGNFSFIVFELLNIIIVIIASFIVGLYLDFVFFYKDKQV